MRRSLTTGAMLLLALSTVLTGCGGGDSGVKAGSKAGSSASPSDLPTNLPTDLPTEIPSCLASALPTELPTNPTEVPSDVASCLPSNLPTELPTDLPTDLPSDLPTDLPTSVPTPTPGAGGVFDACAVVTAALIQADFGGASTGTPIGQASSFGDPNAKDCYYVGGSSTIVIQATTRADQDLPASSYSYAGLPGAEPIKGDATRGWAYVYPGQEGADSITSGLILVKGQIGMNFSITIEGHPYSNANLQKLAKDILPSL